MITWDVERKGISAKKHKGDGINFCIVMVILGTLLITKTY